MAHKEDADILSARRKDTMADCRTKQPQGLAHLMPLTVVKDPALYAIVMLRHGLEVKTMRMSSIWGAACYVILPCLFAAAPRSS